MLQNLASNEFSQLLITETYFTENPFTHFYLKLSFSSDFRTKIEVTACLLSLFWVCVFDLLVSVTLGSRKLRVETTKFQFLLAYIFRVLSPSNY